MPLRDGVSVSGDIGNNKRHIRLHAQMCVVTRGKRATLSCRHTMEKDAYCGMGCHGNSNDIFLTCCWQIGLVLSKLQPLGLKK